MAVTVCVLGLQTAFGIEPILYTCYIIGLFIGNSFIFVEIVIRGYYVKFGKHMGRYGCIVTITFNVSVFSSQVFCTYIYGFVLMVAPADQRFRA